MDGKMVQTEDTVPHYHERGAPQQGMGWGVRLLHADSAPVRDVAYFVALCVPY